MATEHSLLQAVDALYHNSDQKVKDAANKWLEEWQQKLEAWQVSNSVLHNPSTSLEAHYFCAQTLRTKVICMLQNGVWLPTMSFWLPNHHYQLCVSTRLYLPFYTLKRGLFWTRIIGEFACQVQRDFEELTSAAAVSLRDSLIELILKYSKGAPPVRTQLCLALVATVAHMPAAQWDSGGVVVWLSRRLSQHPSEVALPCMLELLTVLPQVGDSYLHCLLLAVLTNSLLFGGYQEGLLFFVGMAGSGQLSASSEARATTAARHRAGCWSAGGVGGTQQLLVTAR
jgi:transportin-3